MFRFFSFFIATVLMTSCASHHSQNTSRPRSPASTWQPNGGMNQSLPQSESTLFSSNEPVQLILHAEFDRVHKANFGGNWTGEDRDDKTDENIAQYWDLKGKISDASKPERVLAADVRGRGMSSAQTGEAQFPKLKVEIHDDEDLKKTLFKGARNFRINTHVNTHPKTEHTKMGRLNNENSPYREATAYEMGNAMGLPTPVIRRARIQYTDTGLQQSFERNALLIETNKKIGERFQAKETDRFPSLDPENQIDIHLAARFHLFNILIGNDDVGLKLKKESATSTEKYRPYFNTTVYELPDGQLFPVLYDLDLASIVAGWRMLNYKLYQYPSLNIKDGRIGRFINGLAFLRSRLNKLEYQQALTDFADKEKQLLDVIQNAVVDNEFKKHAAEHIQLLKKTVTILNTLPMLKKAGVQFFKDVKLSKSLLKPDNAMEVPGTLRPGTPIKVIKKMGQVVQIAIVDFKHDLEDSKQNVGYIPVQDLILDFDLPEDLQGHIDGRDMAY